MKEDSLLRILRSSFRAAVLVLLVLAVALGPAATVSAQEIRGSLLGRIIDPSGASIPGAKVIIVNQATNLVVEVMTNIEGNYVAAFLAPGEYTLSVEKQGFNKATRGDVIVRTQDRLTFDFTLQPGSVTESITVTAASPMIQTSSADFGQVVNNTFMNRLPVVGVNPINLADMAPGVVPTTPDGNVMNYTTSRVQINGSTGMGNQMTIDGAPSEVPRMSGVSYFIPMAEMVAELKVVTAMFDAAQGRTNGGSILVTTKGGTNRYHGSAYYHIRDERFNANSWSNNYFGQRRGQQNYWLAGGTINGPVLKDKTFFSLGLEKERNIGNVNYQFRVPTALERQGDFSQTLNSRSQALQLYDPLTTVLDARGNFVSRTPIPGARIPSGRINAVGGALANVLPTPNYLGFPNQLSQVNYLTSANSANPILSFQSRVDHVLTARQRLLPHPRRTVQRQFMVE